MAYKYLVLQRVQIGKTPHLYFFDSLVANIAWQERGLIDQIHLAVDKKGKMFADSQPPHEEVAQKMQPPVC